MKDSSLNAHKAWYSVGAGASLAADEHHIVAMQLKELYGYYLCYLGEPTHALKVHDSIIRHRIYIHPHDNTTGHLGVRGDYEAIPLRSDSIDAIVLMHSLEQSLQPHEVLREAHRTLIPDGRILITGINPHCSWGLWYRYQQLCKHIPRSGRLLAMNRIVDWLLLLNFEITLVKRFHFHPPYIKQHTDFPHSRMAKVGQKCWPFMGGGYFIMATKRNIPLTPIKSRWRFKELISETANLPKASA